MSATLQPSEHRLAQNQFLVFDGAGDRIALSEDERRRVLLLSPRQWSDWSRLKSGGPLPQEPGLPVMLRRLGAASYRLERIAERQALKLERCPLAA